MPLKGEWRTRFKNGGLVLINCYEQGIVHKHLSKKLREELKRSDAYLLIGTLFKIALIISGVLTLSASAS